LLALHRRAGVGDHASKCLPVLYLLITLPTETPNLCGSGQPPGLHAGHDQGGQPFGDGQQLGLLAGVVDSQD
jgi:hypothetical protein